MIKTSRKELFMWVEGKIKDALNVSEIDKASGLYRRF
jgi:hypothetical protein